MRSTDKLSALITGCNGGIGSALCTEFRATGYLVIGSDLQSEAAADCDFYIQSDLVELVSNETARQHFYSQLLRVVAEHSSGLRALINNAALQVVRPLRDLEMQDFLLSQQVNVIAPYMLARLFEPSLRHSAGSIVNIGSIHARLSKPGFCAYSTSKAGLSGLTRALALEFGTDVTVNTILPAATKTEMLVDGFKLQPEKFAELAAFHPVGRIGEPQEIARLALFLCSEDARFITGADIPIDGGIGGRLHDPV
jgi:NAD(P)-dependent dehydrogenase (short-subunit alcohol dehydrogenase family)